MFKKIYIEITNVCNLKCKFCPETNRKKEFMTLEKFEEIIRTFQAQFSITWDINNLVSNLYGIYKNASDNKIYEYGLFQDGQSKDNPIYPF